eukprot:g10212.t1
MRTTLVIVLLWSLSPTALAAHKPNVVFILADDLGYGDVHCFGGKRCRIKTPNFDRLAAEGMRFTDAHAIASVCVPSRIGIMTGRYAWRFRGPRFRAPWGFMGPVLPDGQFTLGTMLRASGYRTGYVGKWHLGTLMPTKDGKTQGPNNVDYTVPLKIGPPQYGFDDSFILPGSLDMYPYAFVRNNHWVGKVTAQKGFSAFNRVGPAAEDFEDVKVLDTFSKEAERFISKNAEKAKAGKPFFLYLALTAPHTPVSPSAPFVGKSPIGVYGDFVRETDHCVGRVMAALKQHGVDSNTLIIATSDHGAAAYAGRRRKATFGQMIELEKEGHYARGPFRGYKFSAYEGGFRVACVARWPGVVRAGARCDALIGLNDTLATLADICGHKLKSTQAPDSISFLPLLRNADAKPPRTDLVLRSTEAFALRSGPWKLLLCPGSGCAGRFGNSPPSRDAWKQAVKAFGRVPRNTNELERAPFVQLFNLDKDVAETTNLAAKRPEKVRELIRIMRKRVADGRCTPGPKLPNDVPTINIVRRRRDRKQKPNIVWIIVEDMSAHFGCYGETAANTPHVDALAAAGVQFTRAYVTAPVCSTCRSALITGMYQTSIGAHHHRSGRGVVKIRLPNHVQLVPQLFRQAGYYTCNGSLGRRSRVGKTDYNFEWDKSAYDGSDWSNRKQGQPFFAQIQLAGGKLRGGKGWPARAKKALGSNTPRSRVKLPPYYPQDSVIVDDWAQYLDAVRMTDKQVGQIIQRLKDEGILEHTYVFFITDHGISHARGKQFCYEEGMHIPFVVRGPGLNAGRRRDDLIVHIDMAATSLAFAGIDIPNSMQSVDLFARDYQPREFVVSARDRCDETVDRIRGLVTKRYKYIRNFYPKRPYLQPNAYKDHKPILVQLRKLHAAGQLNRDQLLIMAGERPVEELYDLKTDPHELRNLAGDVKSRRKLAELRGKLNGWIKRTGDLGQKPESTEMYDSDMAVYLNALRRRRPERLKVIEANIKLMKSWALMGR